MGAPRWEHAFLVMVLFPQLIIAGCPFAGVLPGVGHAAADSAQLASYRDSARRLQQKVRQARTALFGLWVKLCTDQVLALPRACNCCHVQSIQ